MKLPGIWKRNKNLVSSIRDLEGEWQLGSRVSREFLKSKHHENLFIAQITKGHASIQPITLIQQCDCMSLAKVLEIILPTRHFRYKGTRQTDQHTWGIPKNSWSRRIWPSKICFPRFYKNVIIRYIAHGKIISKLWNWVFKNIFLFKYVVKYSHTRWCQW